MANYTYSSSAPWHDDSSNIKIINISNGITSIGNYVFCDCYGVTSIMIPDSVTNIGNDAFYYCIGLTSLTFGENSKLASIGNRTFFDCYGLTSITIPSSVTSIGESAFSCCSKLTSITVESGNTVYKSDGNCLIRIADNFLIQGCNKSVIPDYIKCIGDYAFSNCAELTSITIPSGVTSIGDSTFNCCFGLKKITIPSGVTSIGDDAFSYCTELTSITIPSGVTSIGDNAFSHCSGFTSITIPSGVTSIGDGAFSNCVGLISITFGKNSKLTCIDDFVFYKCSGLTSITIPSGVTSIGTSTFYECFKLTSIIFGENSKLTSIGNYAFHRCTGLISIIIPSGVTSIGEEAFNNCTGLTSITVESVNTVYKSDGNCLIRIADNCLIQGFNISVIPDYVKSIGDYAFSDCSGLTSITIPSGVTSIGTGAFFRCTGLESITLSENSKLTSIGDNAFYECSEITSITIPNNVTSIGDGVFDNCAKLSAIHYYGTQAQWNAVVKGSDAIPSGTKILFAAEAFEDFNVTGAVKSIPDGYIPIYTGSELASIGANTKYPLDGKYFLMNDIDMTGVSFKAIGSEATPFTGIFNGNGCIISNLTVVGTRAGMFAANSGTIKNIILSNPNIISSTITGSYGNSSTYTIEPEIGGIASKNCESGVIENCCVENGIVRAYAYEIGKSGKTVTAYAYCGGIVGRNLGTITKCSVSGTAISAYSVFVPPNFTEGNTTLCGGITGYYVSGSISDCYIDSDVTISAESYSEKGSFLATFTFPVSSYAGGIVGMSDTNSTIVRCISRILPTVKTFVSMTGTWDAYKGTEEKKNGYIVGYNKGDKTGFIKCPYIAGSTAVGKGASSGCTSCDSFNDEVLVSMFFPGTWIKNDDGFAVLPGIEHEYAFIISYKDNKPVMLKGQPFNYTGITIYYAENVNDFNTYVDITKTATLRYDFSSTGKKTVGIEYNSNFCEIEFDVIQINKLTINYVYSDGTTASAQYVSQMTEGEAYNISSPVISGYIADKLTVSGTMGTGDITVTVTYKKTTHTLTIIYKYENGNQVTNQYTASVGEGSAYSVVSPVIEGYDADKPTVSGTMGTSDVAVTVTYKKHIWNGSAAAGFASGNGTLSNPYIIKTSEQLAHLAVSVNEGIIYSGKYFKLANDIILNDITNVANWATSAPSNAWRPIGISGLVGFAGTFDGCGYKVIGIYIITTSDSNLGLFGCSSGMISNVDVVSSYIGGNNNIGGICGYSSGTIKNCNNSAVVKGTDNVGGICGSNAGTITECNNKNTVNGSHYSGGICGLNVGTVSDCKNAGAVGSYLYIGGICGESRNGNGIIDCINTGDIKGSSYTGGICGKNSSSVSGSSNDAAVTGSKYIGGISGYCTGTIDGCKNEGEITSRSNGSLTAYACGGICGGAEGADGALAKIKSCKNYGEITGTDNVGGICGLSGECKSGGILIEACNNSGDITGSGNVGGISGCNTASASYGAEINKCYNAGMISGSGNVGGICGVNGGNTVKAVIASCCNLSTVSGTDKVGGISGENGGTVSNCYNIADISGDNTAGGICGNSTSTVSYCYNVGSVGGKYSVGGICGAGSATGCYYVRGCACDSEKTVQNGIGAAVSGNTTIDIIDKTTVLSFEQMKAQNNYKLFDYSTAWIIGDISGFEYPTLRWQSDGMGSLTTHKLTIKYIDENDRELKTADVFDILENMPYSKATPVISGYDAGKENVFGTIGIYDVTVTVRYYKIYTVIFKNGDNIISTKYYHSGDIISKPANPSRASDKINEYTYEFAGWTLFPDTATVIDIPQTVIKNSEFEKVYIAKYNTVPVNYTVTFKNAAGADISKKTDYHVGDTVTVPGGPGKSADAQYTYTFIGWNTKSGAETTAAVEAVITAKDSHSVTYYPVYSKTLRKYTVTFYSEGKTTKLSETEIGYGEMPVAPSCSKQGEANNYSWTLTWSPAVSKVTGNAEYVAVFTKEYVDYTVIFKDYLGKTISGKSDYHVGDTVSVPSNPAKPKDNTYTYTFVSWAVEGSPETAVTVAGTIAAGNVHTVTYVPIYSKEYISYTVRFTDYDGTAIASGADGKTYHYGDIVSSEDIPADPERLGYEFTGWSPEVGTVNGNTVYKATYTSDFKVRFTDEDGTPISAGVDGKIYHYGDKIASSDVPANPTKAADSTYTYSFKCWSPEYSETVRKSVTYKAVYEKTYIEYNVTFYDTNRTTVIKKTTYHYGQMPVSPQVNPLTGVKNVYMLVFTGWDTAIHKVEGNQEYYAIRTEDPIEYTVIFKNASGADITKKTDYHVGDTVTVPDGPEKSADAQYTYTFIGWNVKSGAETTSAVEAVITAKDSHSVTYYPVYSKTLRKYTVTFCDRDDNVLSSETYDYGYVLTANDIPADRETYSDGTYVYTFKSWGSSFSSTVTKNITYKPVYNKTLIEEKLFTVTFYNEDKTTVLKTAEYKYGGTPVAPAVNAKPGEKDNYRYVFDKWTPDIHKVDGDNTYVASYKKEYYEYTVKFINYNGVIVSEKKYRYGDTVIKPAVNPAKPDSKFYTYIFSGWTPEITEVRSDATYTAQYNEINISGYESGEGTKNKPFVIVNAEQLLFFASKVNGGESYENTYFRLGADISLNNTENYSGWDKAAPENTWVPIGNLPTVYFGGLFDGDGYTISGIYMNGTSSFCGLFGYLIGADVRNVTVEKSYIRGSSFAGAICGYSNGTIYNCTGNSAVISASKYAGGICGRNSEGIIEKCSSSVTVSGGNYTGGISGQNNGGVISSCYNTGSVTGEKNTGGICGTENEGSVFDCYNTGAVSGTSNIGGICGYNTSGQLLRCYNAGRISGDKKTGGICGNNIGSISRCYYYSVVPKTDILKRQCGLTDSQMSTQAAFEDFDFGSVWMINTDGGYNYPLLKWQTAIPEMPAKHTLTVIYAYSGNEFPAVQSEYTVLEGYDYSVETPSHECYKPDISKVCGTMGMSDITVTVTYSYDSEIFTVIFNNHDGTEISRGTYHYGAKVTEPEAPTRADEYKYVYLFSGWNSEVTAVTGDTVYTANYSIAEKLYLDNISLSGINEPFFGDMPDIDVSADNDHTVVTGVEWSGGNNNAFGNYPKNTVTITLVSKNTAYINSETKVRLDGRLLETVYDEENHTITVTCEYGIKYRYSLYILDSETKMPLSGVTATLGTQTATSDSRGRAVFVMQGGVSTSLKLEKTDYVTYETDNYMTKQSLQEFIVMRCAYSGVFPVSCNGKDLTSSKSLINMYLNKTAEIVVIGCAQTRITGYFLIQDETVIAESDDGIFKVNNSKFIYNKPVVALIETESGEKFSETLNISITNYDIEHEISSLITYFLKSVGGLDFEIPDSFTLTSAQKFKFKCQDIGVDIELDNDSAEVECNLEHDWLPSPAKLSSEVTVKLKAKYGEDGLIDITGGLVFKGSIGYSVQSPPIIVAYVPVYIDFYFGVYGKIVFNNIRLDWNETTYSNRPTFDHEVGVGFEIKPKLAVGFNVLNAGLYGKLDGSVIYDTSRIYEINNIRDINIVPDKITIKGEFGVYAKLNVAFIELGYEVPLFSVSYTEYFRYQSYYGYLAAECNLYDINSYMLSGRKYLSSRSIWYGGTEINGETLIRSSVYGGIKPQLVSCDGKTVMFFMDDDGSEGENYRHLYYSVYNVSAALWGAPVSVDGNALPDGEFSVYSDGDNIDIVYTEYPAFEGAVITEDDYPEIKKSASVVYISFDAESESFSGREVISGGDGYETMPDVISDNGTVYVTWLVNDSDDVFMQNTENKIVSRVKTVSGWEKETTVAENCATITSTDIGFFGSGVCIAYITDTDCKLATENDRRINVSSVTGSKLYTGSKAGAVDNIGFADYNSNDIIIWYCDSNLEYLKDTSGEINTLFENAVDSLPSDYRLTETADGDFIVTYPIITKASDGKTGSDLYCIFCDNGIWGQPVRLTYTADDRYTDAYDIALTDGEIIMVYLASTATITETDVDVISDLAFSVVPLGCNVETVSVDFDENDYLDGGNVTLSAVIKNNSCHGIEQIKVRVSDGNGNTVYEKIYDVSLFSGEERTFGFEMPCNTVYTDNTYTVTILPVGYEDNDNVNNTENISFSCTDLSCYADAVTVLDDKIITYAVRNEGNTVCGATLTVYRKSTNGDVVVFTENIPSVEIGGVYTGMLTVTSEYFNDGKTSGTVYLKITPSGNDSNELNDCCCVTFTETTEPVTELKNLYTPPYVVDGESYFDRNSGGDYSVTVEENGMNFIRIIGVETDKYTYDSGVLTIYGSYLKYLEENKIILALEYEYGGKITVINISVGIIGKLAAETVITAEQTGEIIYDGSPVVPGKDFTCDVSTSAPVIYSYSADGGITWNQGLPVNAGAYSVRANVTADTDGEYTSASKTFSITISQASRAVSSPAIISVEGCTVTVGEASATVSETGDKLYYAICNTPDEKDITEWSEQNLLAFASDGETYYVFAKVSGGCNYKDAISSAVMFETEISVLTTISALLDSSSGYTVDAVKGYLRGIKDGKNTVSEVLSAFTDTTGIKIINSKGIDITLNNTEKIGTGTKIQLTGGDGNVTDEAVVIIKGDVDGDGKVTLVDCMKLRAQQLGKISELDGAFLQAGLDIEPGISSLGIVHYMKLRAYQLGKTNEL